MNEQLKMQLHKMTSDPITTMEQMIEILESGKDLTYCLCYAANDIIRELKLDIGANHFLEMLGITENDVIRLMPEQTPQYDSAYWFKDSHNPAPRIEYLKLKINELKSNSHE